MFRRLVQLAAVAAVAVLPFAMAGGASASAGHPAAPAVAPPCAAGFAPITNQAGFAIAGNGVNAPVTIGATGNCFKPMDPNNYGQGTSFCYQNGDGHALWVNGSTIELGGGCHASGHPNEQFLGASFIAGQGWALASIGANYNFVQPVVCGEGGSQVHTPASVGSCPRWTLS